MSGLWLGTWMRFWVGQRLAPFVPTPTRVAAEMLRLARVGPQDHVYDLGCGDGRLLVMAAQQFGAEGVGFELHPELVEQARSAVARANLQHRVTIHKGDALAADLSEATVVTLYLSTAGNKKLVPVLREKGPKGGCRVVSFCWEVEGLSPLSVRKVDGVPIFLYSTAPTSL